MRQRLLAVALLTMTSTAFAQGTEIVCPEDYPTSLLSAKGVPQGWEGIAHVAGIRMVLISAGVVVGPPNQQVQGLLRGKEFKTANGYSITFPNLATFAEPQEKWVYCAYGAGGDVQLLHRLPNDVAACRVDAKRNPYNGHDIRVTCSRKH